MDGQGAGEKRLDGWKAIAAYFNRDRTTAMRWARERGLPIRRMPGGKQGSVFAFEHELAAWALSQRDVADPETPVETETPAPAPEADALPAPSPTGSRKRGIVGLAVAAMLAVAATYWIGVWRSSPPARSEEHTSELQSH